MTDEPIRQEDAKPRTFLPNNPETIATVLSNPENWVRGDGKHIPLREIPLDHGLNIINWLEGQTGYILQVLGRDPEAISAASQRYWLHQQPFVKALNARMMELKRAAESSPPPGMEPSGWLLEPLAALDLETTGVDLENDRMVAFSVGVAEELGEWKSVTKIVNAGVEIPEGASRVHGITTDRMKEEGIPEKEALTGLAKSLKSLSDQDIPVIGHGIRFDLTILDRTSRRLTGERLHFGPVLDTLVLDKTIDQYRRGKRTLDAECEHYKIEAEQAHVADHDAKRALRLLWAMMTSAKAREFFNNQLPSLHEMDVLQKRSFAEQQSHLKSWQGRQGSDIKDLNWPVAGSPRTVDRLSKI